MRISLKYFLVLLLAVLAIPIGLTQVLAAGVDPHSVGSTLELHIDDNSQMVVEGLRVIQKAGSSLFTRVEFGNAYVRITVVTNSATVVTRRFGGKISVADISPEDILSVRGDFLAGSDSLMISAKTIKDWSLQKEPNDFSGTITSVSGGGTDFNLLDDDSGKTIKVHVGESTDVVRGVIFIKRDELKVGDKIVRASGSYDVPNNFLDAARIDAYQDPSIFVSRNFQGTLKSLSGTTLPITAVVSAEGKEYTVYLSKDATILNKIRSNVSLSRFLVGDVIRFYGAIRKTDLTAIDASLVRNISL